MNDNTPQPWIDPALEARIVAHVLGEISAFETAELERLLTENPELALFKRRIEAVHSLVGLAVRPENPKIQLSPDRRKKLLETIGVPTVVPDKKIRTFPPRRPAWWSPQVLLRIAACLILTTMVLAIVSQVSLFRNSAEPPESEGYAGERGFAFNVDQPQGRAAGPSAADDSSPGAGLAGDEGPEAPTVSDLTSNKSNSDRSVKLSEGVIVSTGVVTAVQPDFSSPQNQPREFAALKQELLNKRQEQLAQADQQVEVGKDLEISQTRARRNSMAGETDTKQLSSSEEKLQQLPEDSANLVSALQAQLSAPQSRTEAAGSAAGTAASDYLNGAPSDAPAPSAQVTVWDGQTSASGHLIAETTVEKNKTYGRDGTTLPSVPEQSLKDLTKTDTDQPVFAQANKEVAPVLGDVPLSRQMVRDESRTDVSPSPQTANIINQPIFSTREDGKVEFDGFVNYGSPITTLDLSNSPVETTKSGQHASQQVVRELHTPTSFDHPPRRPRLKRSPQAARQRKPFSKRLPNSRLRADLTSLPNAISRRCKKTPLTSPHDKESPRSMLRKPNTTARLLTKPEAECFGQWTAHGSAPSADSKEEEPHLPEPKRRPVRRQRKVSLAS